MTTPREKETLPTNPKMAIARFLAFPAGNVLTVRLLPSTEILAVSALATGELLMMAY
jgi:hypothetical protein